jgi:hypothetical protein
MDKRQILNKSLKGGATANPRPEIIINGRPPMLIKAKHNLEKRLTIHRLKLKQESENLSKKKHNLFRKKDERITWNNELIYRILAFINHEFTYFNATDTRIVFYFKDLIKGNRDAYSNFEKQIDILVKTKYQYDINLKKFNKKFNENPDPHLNYKLEMDLLQPLIDKFIEFINLQISIIEKFIQYIKKGGQNEIEKSLIQKDKSKPYKIKIQDINKLYGNNFCNQFNNKFKPCMNNNCFFDRNTNKCEIFRKPKPSQPGSVEFYNTDSRGSRGSTPRTSNDIAKELHTKFIKKGYSNEIIITACNITLLARK